MEEKVLIRSEMDSKAKTNLFRIVWLFLGFGILSLLSLFLIRDEYARCNGWACIFRSYGDIEIYYTILGIGGVFLVTGLILFFCFKSFAKCELTVTEHSVKGKTIGGKVVVLPLQQISAYSTIKWNSTIAVATSSGTTKFSLIKNYEEIGNILSKKINSKQEPAKVTISEAPAKNDSMEDLVKLKSLLDSGIITKEEFDAKKKQLLGI